MRQRTKNRHSVAGSAVYKIGDRVEVDVSTMHFTATMSPQQVAQLLAEVAAEDHNSAVCAVLIALRNERRSDEYKTDALFVALEAALSNWRRERVEHVTIPAASTRQAREGTSHE